MENFLYSGNFNWVIPHLWAVVGKGLDEVQSGKVLFSAVHCIIVFCTAMLFSVVYYRFVSPLVSGE